MLGKIHVIATAGTNNDSEIESSNPPTGSEYVLLSASGYHNMVAAQNLRFGIKEGSDVDWGLYVSKATLAIMNIGESMAVFAPGLFILTSTVKLALAGAVDATHHLDIVATVLERPANFEEKVEEWRMVHPGQIPPDVFEDLVGITGYSSTLLATEWARLYPGETTPDNVYTLLKERMYTQSLLRMIKVR